MTSSSGRTEMPFFVSLCALLIILKEALSEAWQGLEGGKSICPCRQRSASVHAARVLDAGLLSE